MSLYFYLAQELHNMSQYMCESILWQLWWS